MRALLINADGTPPHIITISDTNPLPDLQEAVGGYIEPVATWTHGVSIYCNEEGKVNNLPVNQNKAAIEALQLNLAPHDVIVGNLIVTGYNPATGDDEDVPDIIARIVIRAAATAREDANRPAPKSDSDLASDLKAAVKSLAHKGEDWPDVLDRVRSRYTSETPPPCVVCGKELQVMETGAGTRTKFACDKPDGVTYADFHDHYQRSVWFQLRTGDWDVRVLVDAVEAALRGR